MSDPLATVDDLTEGWRPLSPAETRRASALLRRASGLIRDRVPGLDRRIADGRVSVDTVVSVVCEMTRRAMMPPVDGSPVTQQAEAFNGFSLSQSYATETGDLYPTSSELKALRGGQRFGSANVMPDPGRPR
jgi:hypothetical protein